MANADFTRVSLSAPLSLKGAQLTDKFALALKQRGLSPKTVEAYTTDARYFSSSVKGSVLKADATRIRRFLAKDLETCAPRTVARRLHSIRELYRWLREQRLVTKNPTANIRGPKIEKRIPRTLTQADIAAMRDSITRQTPLAVRDRMILTLAFATGLRVTEMIALRLHDLHLAQAKLLVKNGKGGKDRWVLLSDEAVSQVAQYIESARPALLRGKSSDLLLIGRDAEGISRQRVFLLIQGLGRKVLGKEISPHWLRHSYATALVEGGMDLSSLAMLLGHSSVDTTQVYVDIDLKHAREVYDRTHPGGTQCAI